MDEGWHFVGSFKIGSVPGMINKEVLANLCVNLHNQLKKFYLGKFGKIITLCILKKESG